MRGALLRRVVVCGAVLAMVVLGAGGVGAASPTWGIALPKNSSATEKNAADGVSCVSATACFAVGGYYTGTNPTMKHTQTQRWNGTRWSIVASPDATGSNILSNFLSGVSCVSPKFCMAVGYYTQAAGAPDQTLTEKWDGTAWSIVPSPNVASVSNDLNAVSCVSAKFCVAAGDTLNGSFTNQTLVERWNGTSWTVETSANTSGTQSNLLWGVSCSTSTLCMATGYSDAPTGEFALIEKRTHTGWRIMKAPNHSGGASFPTDDLWSVSCPRTVTNFCLAAGHYLNASGVKQTLVETWNGTAWSVLASPNVAGAQDDGQYSGVSCATATFCMDSTFTTPTTGAEQTVILEWNGSTLSIVPSANTSSTQGNRLQATSCPITTFCAAVGQYTPTTVSQNLAELWR